MFCKVQFNVKTPILFLYREHYSFGLWVICKNNFSMVHLSDYKEKSLQKLLIKSWSTHPKETIFSSIVVSILLPPLNLFTKVNPESENIIVAAK